MKQYTLGIIFSSDVQHVLLEHKIEPEWQKGKVNAVGGKLEEGEAPIECIIRETAEETSIISNESDRIPLGELVNANGSIVYLFTMKHKGKLQDAKFIEKEKNEWFPVDNLPKNIMTNLTWLIPLAFDKMQNGDIDSIQVKNRK